jgi:hypothetical protein
MAEKFLVTPAQKNAAEGLVKRADARGKPLRPAVRKIANAKVQPVNGTARTSPGLRSLNASRAES